MAERIWTIVYEAMQSFAKLFEIPINKIMRKLFENQEFEDLILKFINDDHIRSQYA